MIEQSKGIYFGNKEQKRKKERQDKKKKERKYPTQFDGRFNDG